MNYGEASLLIKCYLDTSPDRDWEGEKHKDVGEKGDYHRTATISLSNKRWLISNNIYLPEQKKVIIIERHPFPWWMKGDNNPSPGTILMINMIEYGQRTFYFNEHHCEVDIIEQYFRRSWLLALNSNDKDGC